ncbi:MAG: hypothetical protein C4536_02195 [Actinobacteria bacterium]|nr:MAG: hypothetical protein C4536_02195 [Actinomycetota bacterium]
MRKALVALIMILVVAGLVAISGCNSRGQIVNLDKMLMDGESWTYEGYEGDLIVFGEDGSFRLVAGEKVENGAYEVFQTDDGNRAKLTFVDSEGNEIGVEEWTVSGDIGEVDVITDQEGQEFYLKGTKESLR